jgi:hypothetical protein
VDAENPRDYCAKARAHRYATEKEAKDALFNARVNAAVNGARGDRGRDLAYCRDCQGYHRTTAIGRTNAKQRTWRKGKR